MARLILKLALPLMLATACAGQKNITNQYDLVDVSYPNSTYSFPLGINNVRTVVGTFADADGVLHGFIWKDKKFTAVLNYPGAPQVPGGGTFAAGINDRGDIVGFYIDKNGFDHGFLLARPLWCNDFDEKKEGCQAVYKSLDVPGAAQLPDVLFEFGTGLGTVGVGINDLSQVVGLYATRGRYSNGFVQFFGSVTSIEHPQASHADGNGTKCFGVSNIGVLACDYQTQASPTALQITHAFLRDGTENIPIEFPGSSRGGFGTQVSGVNVFGTAVGVYTDVNGQFNAMLWSKGKFYTVNYPGMPLNELHSINDRGDLTGAYDPTGTGYTLYGYIALPR